MQRGIRKTYPMLACRECRMQNAGYGMKIRPSLPRLPRCEVSFRLSAPAPTRNATVSSPKARPTCSTTPPAKSPAAANSRIDATKKLPGEGFKRPWPPLIKMDESVKAKMEKLRQF